MPGTDKQSHEGDSDDTPKVGLPTVSFDDVAEARPTPPPTPPKRVSPLPPRQPGQASSSSGHQQPVRRSDPSIQRSTQSSEGREAAPAGRSADDTHVPTEDEAGFKSPDEMEDRAAKDPALEETQDMDPAEIEKPPPPSGESARISFGQAAVNMKLVTPAQIQECVNVQRALLQKGQRVPLLGQLLVKRGYLDKAGVDKIKNYQQMYSIADKIPGYKLHGRLGQGAMGTVYKARQVRMERWVAIKVLQPELAANATIKQRFLQEARASARLNHPNVITGIDAGEIDGLCYFAMEYVEGKTLQELVKQRGAMDERQALEAILQVAKALEHAEKLSLVHRDVKPDNIMITRDRQVKLLDLGLAKVRAADSDGSTKGMAVGTPNYISPEQAMGRQDIDTRSDIYSLGVTLYFVLTGKVPYEGPPEVVMYRHIHEPPAHPKNFRPDLQESTTDLLFNMTAKRPEDRPASASQLVSDMEHLLRTGKLPGMFESGNAGGSLKVKRDSKVIVNQKRAPRLKGYGMPGTSPGPARAPKKGPQPGPQRGPKPGPKPGGAGGGGPRMPRKRKKRFGGSW